MEKNVKEEESYIQKKSGGHTGCLEEHEDEAI
jgi:hypothetical protein